MLGALATLNVCLVCIVTVLALTSECPSLCFRAPSQLVAQILPDAILPVQLRGSLWATPTLRECNHFCSVVLRCLLRYIERLEYQALNLANQRRDRKYAH